MMNSWNGIHLHHGARNLPQSREGVWFVVKCVLGSRTHLKQPPAGSMGTQGRERAVGTAWRTCLSCLCLGAWASLVLAPQV